MKTIVLTAGLMAWLSIAAMSQEKRADQTSPIDLKQQVTIQKIEGSFSQILTMLSDRTKITLIADGAPRLDTATFEFAGDLQGALDRFGSLFDYRWEVGPSNIVLLRKRFERPDERPQMIVEEIRQYAHAILRLLPAVPPDPSNMQVGMMLVEFSRALNDGQWQALQKGRKTRAFDLSHDQKRLLEKAILVKAFGGPRAYWDRLAFTMENIGSSSFVAKDSGIKTRPPEPPGKYDDVRHVVSGSSGREASVYVGRIAREEQQ